MLYIVPSEVSCEIRRGRALTDVASTRPIMQDWPDVSRRTVLQSVPKPLNDIKYLRDVFCSLHDALGCLSSLHKHGWLHQHLSYENILRVGEETIVADLEDAKTTSDVPIHAGFSAESPFRAVEVVKNAYCFASTPGVPEDSESQISTSSGSASPVSSESDSSDSEAMLVHQESEATAFDSSA
ncbi:hypothetical protein PsYK624_099900 [Phanerochaete sordida]|uniref:Fungal-type protein kinase domain-containing protein n=1 Tax=Phanerochaete sordida TaxID=48140 RepID=A0A9P3GFH8_9APHY|nr:hypothetical protein PsYK624_099900 [Phanerochaete sordida]